MTGLVCPNCSHVLVRDMDLSLAMTRRQRQTLDAIATLATALKRSPNLREVAAALGVKSRSRVHHHVAVLRELGMLPKPTAGIRAVLIPTEAAWRLYDHAA